MIFSQKYTTKWHDTDAFRRVRPTQMLVYMQEVSNLHMQSCGLSLDGLRDEEGLAFILSKIRLSLFAPLYAFEDIEVQTWTCESRGYAIQRFYRIMRGDEVIAVADTIWALVDLNSRALLKGDALDKYPFVNGEPAEMDLPNRIRIPRGLELLHVGERRIVYSDLDYNMHMNNTRYMDMLCDFLPIERVGDIKGFVLSYFKEAHYADALEILYAEQDGAGYFRTVNAAGQICLEAQVVF